MLKLIEISAVDISIYKFVLPLMQELSKNNWNVSVAANNSGYRNQIIDKGYPVHHIEFVRNLAPVSNIKAFLQLIKLFKKEKPDCIHVHTPIAAVLSRIAGRLTGVPHIIYTLHGLYKDKPFIQIEKFVCRYCTDYIFTVNEEDKKYLVKNKFIAKTKIKNINSVGIDTNTFNPKKISENEKIKLKQDLKLNDKPVIGFVGRLVKIKGILELVEAFIEIKKNIDCQLLLIGSTDLGERDQTAINQAKQRIKQAGLCKDVIFAGKRDDIPLCLSIMDIFVLPSYWEGMAVSPLEAMSMELPVIASDIRGCREELTPETGILIPSHEVAPLVKAIELLLNNKSKAKAMGVEGRKHVQKYFSVEKSVAKQLKIFAEL